MEPTLQQKTVRGLQWSTLSTVVNAVMQIGYTSTVARLVAPEAFGLVAIGQTILRFGTYFSEMGLGKAIIQKAEVDARDMRAAFTGAVALGLGFFLIFFFGAPLIAPLFLSDTELIPVIRAMAFYFLIAGFGTVPNNLLRRRLAFKQIAQIEIGTYIVGYGVVGLGLALSGYGLWGLVAAGLSQQLFTGLAAYALVRHPVKPIFAKAAYTPLLAYGSQVSFISFLEFFSANLDTFLIGRLLGPRPLGFYNRAFTLVQLPVLNLTTAVSRVLFPAMSSIQHDLPRLRRVYLSSVHIVAMLVFPVGAGLSVAGPEVVRTLLGPGWEPAIPVLQILALVVPFKLLMNFGGIICDATGKLKVKMAVEGCYILVMALLLSQISFRFGLQGIALTILAGEMAKKAAYAIILQRLLAYRLVGELLLGYVPALGSAVCVALSVWAARVALPAQVLALPALALAIEACAGGVGLLAGMLMPFSKPVRVLVYDRFLSKTSVGANPVIRSLAGQA